MGFYKKASNNSVSNLFGIKNPNPAQEIIPEYKKKDLKKYSANF